MTAPRRRIRAVKLNGRSRAISPRVKFWLEADGKSVFCRGLSDMLQAVDRTHSIKAAAAEIGRSYRFVWARIKEAEAALGAKLVEARVGGSGSNRSELTPLAHDVLRDFDQVRTEVFHLIEGVFNRRLQATLKKHRVG